MSMNMDVNYLAVLVAAIMNMVVGMVFKGVVWGSVDGSHWFFRC
jgi:hypothetical protein